jgi:hypothetical protein
MQNNKNGESEALFMDILVFNKIDGHEDDIKEIITALKNTKNVRLYKRYSVVLKHFEGFINRKIAEMENITVRSYIKEYKAKQLDGLNMGHSFAKKRRINTEQEKLLVDIITTKTADEVGFKSRKN